MVARDGADGSNTLGYRGLMRDIIDRRRVCDLDFEVSAEAGVRTPDSTKGPDSLSNPAGRNLAHLALAHAEHTVLRKLVMLSTMPGKMSHNHNSRSR